MSDWKPRRFWKHTTVVQAEDGKGFSVRLDNSRLRTPAKAELLVPTSVIAELIAAEWDAQAEFVDPESMPVTRAANAAIDRVSLKHAEVADMLAEYGDSDLTCYRAEAPVELIARQEAAWDPLLDWLYESYGARLEPRNGIIHRAQSPDALVRLRDAVHAFDPFCLTAFHDLVTLSGSLVIGLAASKDVFPADQLWDMSRVDEIWQEDQWGADDEATEHANLKRNSFLKAKQILDAIDAVE